MSELYEIPEFTGYYADRQGNIYTTLKQGCRDRYDLTKRIAPIKLKYRPTRKGYARVCMRRDEATKREDVYVHRIIATMFVSNPLNYDTVNHINSNRLDNRAENLEWRTLEDNVKHAMKFGNLGRDSKGRFINKRVNV